VYRHQVGAWTAAGLKTVKAVEIAVGRTTWLVAGLQVISAILFNVHITASYAYISELSSDPTRQAVYNTHFNTIMYVSTLLFMMEVLGVSTLLGTVNVGTARISQILTVVTTLWTAGFCQLYSTIHASHRERQYLMLAIGLSNREVRHS